ncbi:MAG: phosphoribosylglycinamide formyltransferase [Armatimonadota bacterium]
MSLNIAVMVSGEGRGSNMWALIEGCRSGEIDAVVNLVIGTRKNSPALIRAQEAGIRTVVVSPSGLDDEVYAKKLLRQLTNAQTDLICLAGYMRLLPYGVLERYHNRITNIHPALLPEFGGKGMYGEHVHRAVLASGQKQSGCTVHLVDAEYDSGPILLQLTVPVLPDDDWHSLAARVLEQEHIGYVLAVSQLVNKIENNGALSPQVRSGTWK